MSIEDARKKFVVDKTPEFTKKEKEQKVENTNNIINIELSKFWLLLEKGNLFRCMMK